MARGLVALLGTLRSNIAVFDERIAALVQAHPDGALFASLPGAGAALVPRLMVAFGTRRDRFQSAYQMQCYSGIAPEGSQRQNRVDPLPVCLPQVSTANLSRVCKSLDRAIGMGQGLLPAPPRGPEERPSCGRPGAGIQMDSHHLSLLEGRQTLRRASVPSVLAPVRLSTRCLPTVSHWRRVENGCRFPETF
jgi:hypothetical protein